MGLRHFEDGICEVTSNLDRNDREVVTAEVIFLSFLPAVGLARKHLVNV